MRSITVPLIAGLCAACGPRAVPEPPDPAPAPAPASAPVARPSPPPPAERRDIIICVLHRGRLVEVRALYHRATGETITMDSLPFSYVYPLTGEYASVAGWYVNREPIRFRGRRYVRYGHPRVLGVNEVWRMGEYRGVGVYVDGLDIAERAPRIIYLPVRRGCEFQPYANADSLATLPR